MTIKSTSLKDLRDFCDAQFKSADTEGAELLSATEVKTLTEIKNKAESAQKEFDDLAKNYQELLKDYQEAIQHTSNAVKAPETDEPAGPAKTDVFDPDQFARRWAEKNKFNKEN